MYSPLLGPYGLTYPQFLVLQVLWESGVASVGTIGEALSLDSATLTPLLKKLEQKKLVSRDRSKQDERIVLVRPTEDGQNLKKELQQFPKEIGRQCGFSSKDAGDLQRLQAMLERITSE